MTRVLVVDDEPQIRRALATNLTTRGYEVDVAATGEEALRMAAEHRPDVVVLDLGLPGIDGIEVVAGLRGWTEVPIIVLSVRDSEADKVAALDAGADDFVTKPFGMDELLARLRAAVRRSAPPADEMAVVTTEHLMIDLTARRISRDGTEVKLTPTEWHLVEVLVRMPDPYLVGEIGELLDLAFDPDTTSWTLAADGSWTLQRGSLRLHDALITRQRGRRR